LVGGQNQKLFLRKADDQEQARRTRAKREPLTKSRNQKNSPRKKQKNLLGAP
jgi:hypothetical protein